MLRPDGFQTHSLVRRLSGSVLAGRHPRYPSVFQHSLRARFRTGQNSPAPLALRTDVGRLGRAIHRQSGVAQSWPVSIYQQ